MNQKKLNKKLLTSAIFFALFIILTILVLTKLTNKLDDLVNSAMINIQNDNLTNIMTAITNIGSGYALVSITLLITLIAIIRNKRLPISTLTNLVFVFITSHLLKYIIHRPRPLNDYLVNASGYSYPSAHTAVSLAYFIFIAISITDRINNNFLKIIIKIACVILTILIGFSRIYLGVHYLTDVIAGYLLGISCLNFFLNFREKRGQK